MHKLNVLILGPPSFVSTLNELKTDLKFNVLLDNLKDKAEVILFHLEAYKSSSQKNLIDNSKIIKICAGKKKDLFENLNCLIVNDNLGVWEADDEDDLIEEITASTGWCIKSIDYDIQLK